MRPTPPPRHHGNHLILAPSPCPSPQWLTLEDVPSGRLHLRLERLTPRPTAAELEEVRGNSWRQGGAG